MNRRSLVLSVGTDHHPFERAIAYIEDWTRSRGFDGDVFVQHGESRPATVGRNVSLVSREQMMDEYRRATAVVTQGGPGGILDVAAVGLRPIVIPRRPDLGEHVDGHQIEFARFMAEAGEVHLAEDESTLNGLLDRAMEDPEWLQQSPRLSPVDETAQKLEAVVDDVMSRPAGVIRLARLRRVGRSKATGQR